MQKKILSDQYIRITQGYKIASEFIVIANYPARRHHSMLRLGRTLFWTKVTYREEMIVENQIDY